MTAAEWVFLSRLAAGEQCYMQRGALRFSPAERAVPWQLIQRCRDRKWVTGQGRVAITARGIGALELCRREQEEAKKAKEPEKLEELKYRKIMARSDFALYVANLRNSRKMNLRVAGTDGSTIDILYVTRDELLALSVALFDLAYRIAAKT